MIDAVLLFGAMNIVFEFVLLCMLSPRIRCRVLGNESACVFLHFLMLGINLAVHWGTITGSMSSILAFCASLITVQIARKIFGTIDGKVYRPGLVRFRVEELR